MNTSKPANITYIIDGHNFVCEERGVDKPTCDQLSYFLRKVDEWIKRHLDYGQQEPEVIVVLDPSAHDCNLSSDYMEPPIIAPYGERADKSILRTARKLREQNSQQRIIVISNDEKDEFAVLRREKFEKRDNSYLREQISLPVIKSSEFVKDNIDPTENIREFEELFGVKPADNRGKQKDASSEDFSYYQHFLDLNKSSPKVRLNAVKALRDFPREEVVTKLNELLRRESDLKVRKQVLTVLVVIVGQCELDQRSKWQLEDTLNELVNRDIDSASRDAAINIKRQLYKY